MTPPFRNNKSAKQNKLEIGNKRKYYVNQKVYSECFSIRLKASKVCLVISALLETQINGEYGKEKLNYFFYKQFS